MAARKYSPPRTWIVNDGEWPAGPFAPDAPPYALVTAAIVRHYAAAAGSRSLRSVAREAGIDATSLGRTLAGETVPDVHTVAVLEDALGTPCGRSSRSATPPSARMPSPRSGSRARWHQRTPHGTDDHSGPI